MDTGKCGVYMTGFYSTFKKKGNPKVFKKISEPGKLTVKSCTLDSERQILHILSCICTDVSFCLHVHIYTYKHKYYMFICMRVWVCIYRLWNSKGETQERIKKYWRRGWGRTGKQWSQGDRRIQGGREMRKSGEKSLKTKFVWKMPPRSPVLCMLIR